MSDAPPPDPVADELKRLREENAFLRSVLRYAGDIVVTTDRRGRVTEWSAGAEKILGWTKEEMLGRPAAAIYVDPKERRALVKRLSERRGEPLLDQEVRVRTRDGRALWLSLSIADLRDDRGRRIGTVGVSKDVTERVRLDRELRRLSNTDRLTGLYNQAHFFERLEIEKERARRLAHGLVLMLFDLDRFKEYNDAHGHEAGDRVLRFVGSVIFQSIRKEVDSGFRYGGDEFCCLLPGTGFEGALIFAERVRSAVEERGFGVTTSIGLCPFDPEDPRLQIVKAADHAMYRAKRAGGNRICVHGRDGEAWRASALLRPDAGASLTAAAAALARAARGAR